MGEGEESSRDSGALGVLKLGTDWQGKLEVEAGLLNETRRTHFSSTVKSCLRALWSKGYLRTSSKSSPPCLFLPFSVEDYQVPLDWAS